MLRDGYTTGGTKIYVDWNIYFEYTSTYIYISLEIQVGSAKPSAECPPQNVSQIRFDYILCTG